MYEYIQQKATHIIHAAWAVNFSLSLNSFDAHFQGLQSLLNLGMSCSRETQVLFCSSTASVLGRNHAADIHECVSSNPEDCDSLGYSKSKWVAEAICHRASQEAGMSRRVKVLRIGQLTGDTENGIWNTSEAWPLMLSTVDALGCLPRLDQKLTWLPMDIAAHAVVDVALGVSTADDADDESCLVYHIVNNNTDKSWNDLLVWIQASGESFDVVEMDEWLKKLEELDTHPVKSLAGLWKKGSRSQDQNQTDSIVNFNVTRAESISESLRCVGAIDEVLVGKMWAWLKNEVALQRPIVS